jgi:hypothetical protein
VLGGLLGDIWGGWLHVSFLWVARPLRQNGWARRLMREAERYAIARGAHDAHLETFSFQARPLYEKLGYELFGQLDDFPPGHTKYSSAQEADPTPMSGATPESAARRLRGSDAAAPSDHRSDVAVLALLALAKLLFHLATSQGYGIFRDELYYIACSDHLALGYVDHPALSIALLWLARHTLGDSLLAIRFLAGLAGAASVFVTGLIARELGGGRGAQVLAALAVFFAPVLMTFGHFFSMNVFDLLFWSILELLAVQILKHDRPRLWLVLGVVAGLGLNNKYSVGFLLFGLGVGLLISPQRRQLATRWPWLAGGLAALIFLPHVWWEAQNGWPSLEFMARASVEKNLPISPLDFFLQQILLLSPLAFPLWFGGLCALLFAPSMRPVRALGWAYVAVFVLFVTQHAKVYYLAPLYPVVFAAGAVALGHVAARRQWRWPLPVADALIVAGGLIVLPLAVPVLPVETFLAYQDALGLTPPQMERTERGALPQVFADMFGWTEQVDTVARVYAQLPAEQRARAVVLVRNYGEAGAIDFLGKERALPRAISGHNNYWLWGPGDLRDGDTVIALGPPREVLEQAFSEVERVDTVHCRYCIPFESELPVHVARGFKVPLAELWQRLKRFI